MKTPFTIPNFLTPPSTEVSHFVAQDTQLVICCGVNPCYKPGELRKDTGYAAIATQIHNQPIYSMFNFEQSASVKNLLATTNDTTGVDATELWYSTGGNFAQISVGTTWNNFTQQAVSMESFLGYCFFVGCDPYGNFLPVGSLTGTTFSTSTNVQGMPQGKYIVRYRSRLYVANCYYGATPYPFRVQFCDEPVAGAITWNTGLDFFDIDYSDYITGMGTNWDQLMVFTKYATYMYNQTSLANVFDVGCTAHRTIQNVEGYMVWANYENVYASAGGGRPAAIGNDILELLRNANLSASFAEVVDNEYHLYLGITSANGISYANCVATYNFDQGMWRWREYTHQPTAFAVTDLTGFRHLYFGSPAGIVYMKGRYSDGYYSDAGNSFASWFRTRGYDFGSPEVLKRTTKVFAYTRDAGNLQARIRAYDKETEAIMLWTNMMKVHNASPVPSGVIEYQPNIEGHFIQFEFKEMGQTQPWIFNALTCLVAQTSQES
jgi:hypothetical protein